MLAKCLLPSPAAGHQLCWWEMLQTVDLQTFRQLLIRRLAIRPKIRLQTKH